MNKKLTEGQKYVIIHKNLIRFNPDITTLTLLIRDLSDMIAQKTCIMHALATIEIDKLKGPRTVDEFLAKLEKEIKDNNN